MRLFMYLLALLVLIACASCSSKSGRLVERQSNSVNPLIVQYDTAAWKLVNDTVAIRRSDNAIFYREQAYRDGPIRFYKAE